MIALNALATAGAAAAASSVVLLHPHQQVYFNGLEDRTTPWRIRERYDFGYWGPTFRAGLERALAERPGTDVRVCGGGSSVVNWAILRREERTRITLVEVHDDCDIALSHPRQLARPGRRSGDRPIVPPAWSLTAYGGAFLDAFDMDAVHAARRTGDPVPDRPPDVSSMFDVWVHDGRLIYARDGCAPEDLAPRFFLHVEPADPADLPERRRQYGFDNRNFRPITASPAYPWPPLRRSARATRELRGDRCLVAATLPDYPIRRIRTGQFVHLEGGGWRNLWEGEIDLAGEGRR